MCAQCDCMRLTAVRLVQTATRIAANTSRRRKRSRRQRSRILEVDVLQRRGASRDPDRCSEEPDDPGHSSSDDDDDEPCASYTRCPGYYSGACCFAAAQILFVRSSPYQVLCDASDERHGPNSYCIWTLPSSVMPRLCPNGWPWTRKIPDVILREGEFRSFCFWEPIPIEVGGKEQRVVYITVERKRGGHMLAAYGLCRCALLEFKSRSRQSRTSRHEA